MPTRSATDAVPLLVNRVSTPDLSPLQMQIPESVLNRLLAEERLDSGAVQDVIADAEVIGRQRTATRMQVDCRPSDSFAEIHLVLTGAVESDTVGMTRQAAVNTLGRHDVVAIKPVMFDGFQITTKRAKVWVDVQNRHVAASTPLDGVPLLDLFARSTALAGAEQRRKVADAETADRLINRIGPQFNQEADRKLARFNRTFRDELKSQFGNWWPSKVISRTSDSHLHLSATWADAPELSTAELIPADSKSITLRIHESLLNAGLQKLDLAGKTVSETELRRVIEEFITKLGGRVLAKSNSVAASAAISPTIRFADKNPARVQLIDNEVRLIINASLEVSGKTVLSQDEITLPFTSKFEAGDWHVRPGAPLFAKGEQGLSLVGAMESLVRNQLAGSLPEIVMPTITELVDMTTAKSALQLQSTKTESGWLSVSWAVAPDQQKALTAPVPEFIIPASPHQPVREMAPTREPELVPFEAEPVLRAPRIPRELNDSSARSRPRSLQARRPRDPAGWFE